MMWHAHDLLWLASRAGLISADISHELPTWVLNGSGPVVVRRAHTLRCQSAEFVPVGIRGRCKTERCAAFVSSAYITQSQTPFDLVRMKPWMTHALRNKHPVLKALAQLSPLLDSLGRSWGVTGSCGYELATGTSQLRDSSDLDLVINAREFWQRDAAAYWLSRMDQGYCRLDIQLETPLGAIALNEWASGSYQVMLKSNQGPLLTTNPWDLVKEIA